MGFDHNRFGRGQAQQRTQNWRRGNSQRHPEYNVVDRPDRLQRCQSHSFEYYKKLHIIPLRFRDKAIMFYWSHPTENTNFDKKMYISRIFHIDLNYFTVDQVELYYNGWAIEIQEVLFASFWFFCDWLTINDILYSNVYMSATAILSFVFLNRGW